jgi:nicotinamide-nucleotide amidase
MSVRPDDTAAIVTVGTEITAGLRLDTNTRQIALALATAGHRVTQTASVPDDPEILAETLSRLCTTARLVVCTGGLGPTHDDVTLESAASALGLSLHSDESLLERLSRAAALQQDPDAAIQVMRQALVPDGAGILHPETGTAPGLTIDVPGYPGHRLLLLPGPPTEMEPMLRAFLGERTGRATPRTARCTGISESDAQLAAQRVLDGRAGIGLTVLASPGDVHVVLLDEGAGALAIDAALTGICEELADRCYSIGGESLAEVVVTKAREAGITLAVAESCTGGLVGASLTSVPGSSSVFLGGAIAYADEIKSALLGVETSTLATHGAVSADVAEEMALGAIDRTGAQLAVAITGIAGPGGGTTEKPVGLVWFGVARRDGVGTRVRSEYRNLHGDRNGIRTRATVTALDLLRHELAKEGE